MARHFHANEQLQMLKPCNLPCHEARQASEGRRNGPQTSHSPIALITRGPGTCSPIGRDLEDANPTENHPEPPGPMAPFTAPVSVRLFHLRCGLFQWTTMDDPEEFTHGRVACVVLAHGGSTAV